MIRDEFLEAEANGIISFEFSKRVQDEIASLRADIARKSRLIEVLQAQIEALKALDTLGRLFQIADELDAQDKEGVTC